MVKKGNIPWNKGLKGWNSGINNPFYGKHHTKESKQKSREKHLGKLKGIPKSEEHKRKISNSNKNKIVSKETKNKISKNHWDSSGKNNPMYGKIRPFWGKRIYYNSPLQGRICFRSSWEFAYAKYLDSIKELWYYEIETFDLGDVTYTPDFFLPRIDKFIEIKGYMRKKDELKINKFKEEYPWDLEVLRKKDLLESGIITDNYINISLDGDIL